jgi:hypothetical protein
VEEVEVEHPVVVIIQLQVEQEETVLLMEEMDVQLQIHRVEVLRQVNLEVVEDLSLEHTTQLPEDLLLLFAV